MIIDPALDTTEDAFLGGGLRLRQLKSGHRAGHDLDELVGRLQRRVGARADERAGDGPCVALLAVVAQERHPCVERAGHAGGEEAGAGDQVQAEIGEGVDRSGRRRHSLTADDLHLALPAAP